MTLRLRRKVKQMEQRVGLNRELAGAQRGMGHELDRCRVVQMGGPNIPLLYSFTRLLEDIYIVHH